MNSLDMSIEIGSKSVNQFASKTTFQACGGRAIIAYAANDLPRRGFNCNRNTTCLGRKRVTQGIRYELRDNQFCLPTTFGIEQNRLRNCQMQFNTPLSKFERGHGVAKLVRLALRSTNAAVKGGRKI